MNPPIAAIGMEVPPQRLLYATPSGRASRTYLAARRSCAIVVSRDSGS
jgi:hypothetical protein